MILRRLSVVLACLLLAQPAIADTIQLKDGRSLEGMILSEAETSLTVEVEIAGGTIVRTETVDKADVISVQRFTEEQRRERAMERDYRKVRKYAQPPDTNQPLEYYDKVIAEVFRKFLAMHPESPHQQDVMAHIAQWQGERAQAAAGKIKMRGEWMTSEQAAQDQAIEFGRQAEHSIARGDWGHAAEEFESAIVLAPNSGTAAIARHRLPEIYRQWRAALTLQQPKRQADVEAADRRFQQLQQAAQKAEADIRAAQAANEAARQKGVLGAGGQVVAAEVALSKAKAQLASAQEIDRQLRSELEVVQRTLAGIGERAAKAGVDLTAGSEAAPDSNPQPARTVSESPELLTSIHGWLKEYWVYLVGAAVVLSLIFLRPFLK